MNATTQTAAQLDALRLADSIRQRLVNFSADDRFARDETLNEICRHIWSGSSSEGGILSDLWVEGAFPARRSDADLASLAKAGHFNADLVRILDESGAVPSNRPLYAHQKESILQAQVRGENGERPAIVVTAGTSSGKTECFLLPILNDLFQDSQNRPGVKCIILYPMNALVNDQVDRLYSWLQGQTKVRLFHFTSETPEKKRAADFDRVPDWAPCRFRTRQEARGLENRKGEGIQDGPVPDIVITNYSMLEYMLCRPQDAVFFGDALRAVVLDEAHLYTGTLAAEITLLMRRLFARCGVDARSVMQIATSATLGSGAEGELRTFASTIFSKNEDNVHVIQGQSERVPLAEALPPATALTTEKINAVTWNDRPFVIADRFGNVALSQSAEHCHDLQTHLGMLTSHASDSDEDRPARMLNTMLSHAPIIHELVNVLWTKRRMQLSTLAQDIWQDSSLEAQCATFTLLQLAASARASVESHPLVPHRIHLLARATDGVSVCLNKECTGPDHLILPPLGAVHVGMADTCPSCRAAMLLVYRCENCGEWMLAGTLDRNRYRATAANETQLHFFSVDPSIASDEMSLNLSVATAERSGVGTAGLGVTLVNHCPRCGQDRTGFQSFGSGPALTLAILAETLLAELPPYPAAHSPFLPARGRRLLAFSDSRTEAARLGPRLTRQHETQLVRAAIAQALSEQLASDPETLSFLVEEIERLQKRLETAPTTALRQKLERDLRDQQRQLASFQSGGSLSEWEDAIGRNRLLAELLDAETGLSHFASEEKPDGTVRSWSQRDWEKNWGQVKANIMTLLGREFATPSWRASSCETLGLAEITYPGLGDVEIPETVVGLVPNEAAGVALAEVWQDLLRALCDGMRVEGCVTFGSNDEDWSFQTGGVPIGRWTAKHDQGSRLTRFVGQTAQQTRRRFVTAVLKACSPDIEESDELAREVLEKAFDQLLNLARATGQRVCDGELPWLERDERQSHEGASVGAVRIVFQELGLRRPTQLFRCKRTGHVWPRSVAGCAPETGCHGTLEPVTGETLDSDPRLGRLRHEYRESPVFRIGLWAEEHSAQLSPKQNRRLQDLFKAGIRNILSATTTLELGIDIGGLSAVLMGNVPPGKANYLQRAGRAGRRSDGSSAVVTFARPRPFDREVFRRFGDYLDQPLRKPLVFLDRERVVRRHFHSYLLGDFFRSMYGPADRKGAMDAFGSMGTFCGKPQVPYWKDQNSPPAVTEAPASLEARFRNRLFELRDYGDEIVQRNVAALFDKTSMSGAVDNWSDLIQSAIDAFTRSIQDWNDDYALLLDSWLAAVDEGNKPQANAIRYQLKLLAELTVIEALADRQFLPSYGFPIGLQKLRVIVPDESDPKRIREEDQFRLERSGVMAVGEYVPGSQLLAAGKLITSRGLLKHWTGASLDSSPGLRGRFCQCENDHSYYWIAGETEHCPICNGQPKRPPQYLLFVKHGFTSAAWDPPKWSTDVERVGSAETLCISFRPHSSAAEHFVNDAFGGIPGLRADYREDGELLVFNRGENQTGFAICLKCGYADSEPRVHGSGQMNLPASFLRHAPITSAKPWHVCWGEGMQTPVMRNHILAARETTDVLLLDFTNCLGALAADEALVVTLAYAFQNAAAKLLELDSRELGVLVVPAGSGGSTWGAVIYDNVSGGAGHVRELLAQGSEWIRLAHEVVYVDEAHHRRCETGCLDCLLSFDAQRAIANRPFVRRQAYQCLTGLVEQLS
jgi:DEAD/DEAH box helicase domain-containing protein